tara:strand:+ start:1735 stop:1875 length:141 start_codon:yes stop_codon:yes gene_type:complete
MCRERQRERQRERERERELINAIFKNRKEGGEKRNKLSNFTKWPYK